MRKRFLLVFLSVIFVFGCCFGTAGCFFSLEKEKKSKDKQSYKRIDVSSVDDLYAMEEGNFYRLTCDLDLKGKQWKPLTVDGFDGQGYTVSNFSITEAGEKNGYHAYAFLTYCR